MKNLVSRFRKDVKRVLRGYLDKQVDSDKSSDRQSNVAEAPEVKVNSKDSTQWIKKIFFISRKYRIHQVLFRDAIKGMLTAQNLFHLYEEDKKKVKNEFLRLDSAKVAIKQAQEQFKEISKISTEHEGLNKDASITVDLLGRIMRQLDQVARFVDVKQESNTAS